MQCCYVSIAQPFFFKSATYGTDNNDPITENKRLDKDNYVDAKSLKMSFKPARLFVPFACSGRHGTFSFKSCVVLFRTLFKHFNKRTLPVWSRTFSPFFAQAVVIHGEKHLHFRFAKPR